MIRKNIFSFFFDLFYIPTWGRGVFCLWQRNFLYFRQTMFLAMAWIFLEPMLYLFALGYGLGQFVVEIDGKSYAEFIAPAMMTTSGMFVGFFEGAYSTYTKLTRQNTYHSIILTPISADEIVLGEILWVTSKSFFSVVCMGLVLSFMKLIPISSLPLIFLILFVMSWSFSAFGVYLASIAKSYEWFSYFQSGIVIPMSLFCGTYFPIERLPDALEKAAYLLPLTHGMSAVRLSLDSEMSSEIILNCIYLFVFGVAMTNLAVANFNRKLII